MSAENKEEPVKEKIDLKNIKPSDGDKKTENDDSKMEERKKRFGENEKEEVDKKIMRAERFGLTEKEEVKKVISTEEELNKRKERFKQELEDLEEEEKEKEKDVRVERGRIKRNDFRKNNARNNFDRYRKSHRDFRKGGRYPDRRFRGDRRVNSYRK